jgi:hypothetical protein
MDKAVSEPTAMKAAAPYGATCMEVAGWCRLMARSVLFF